MLLSKFEMDNEAGVDEAGRGCLCGPVVAAAVILPPDFSHPKLNDSKKLSHKSRIELREVILRSAIAYGIGEATPAEIDEINILRASHLAMNRAVAAMGVIPSQLLIDGNRFTPQSDIPYHCIIKGDGKYASIAAASILAKTHRDAIMESLHVEHPIYGWDKNMGYPTSLHRTAIIEHGLTTHHRRSFAPCQPRLF
ncbi:MAG: ribonuclease HII [Rikenellaceae bacterium]